uniref:HECT domain-containing protein n=1 Tax=Panagrolaimus davidi TaxID=227884 RepID=A0A914Q4P6_9BILA
MPRLFGVGYFGDGQLGETENHKDGHTLETVIEIEGAPENIQSIASGVKHSIFLTTDGKIYSVGNNESGQLGRDEFQNESFIIAPVNLKGGAIVIQIAAGQFHNAAVSDDGRIFMWGGNHTCQCGEDACEKIPFPRRIYSLTGIVQVDCGENTTVVLTESSSVYIFGLISDAPTKPMEIESLSIYPIIQVAAGGSHFTALTASGQVFCWGKNTNGQLTGTLSDKFKFDPIVVELSKVISIACGSKHTVVLTTEGRVFTFGNNSQGQLGDSKREDAVTVPKIVSDLLGTSITGISCGGRFTFAISNGIVYAFGLNNTGQLGIGNFKNSFAPTIVKNISNVKAVYGGYEHSFFLVDDISDLPIHPVGAVDSLKIPKFLSFNHLRRLYDSNNKIELIGELESVFSSVGCLNGSFLYEDDRRYLLGNTSNGLNLDDVMHAMNLLDYSTSVDQFNDIIITSLESCEIFNFEVNQTIKKEPNFESLRVFFLLIWIPPMAKMEKKYVDGFLYRYTQLLCKVADSTGKLFENWFNVLPTRHFNRFSLSLMRMLEYLFPNNYENDKMLRPILNLISRMAAVNKSNEKIPYTHFYLNSLEEKVNVRKDYLTYYIYHHPELTADNIEIPKNKDPFFWFDYPCIMNVVAKSNVLETHSRVQQHTAIQESHHRAIFEGLLTTGTAYLDPYLHFTIRRDNIVNDTIVELMNAGAEDITKPLKVQFQGEEGEDEGGIRKEFFMLYGMFLTDEESQYVWFSGFPVEDTHFRMVGTLCAMAIYNSILVELPFPLALYKFLLDVPFTLEDLLELHPSEGRSLEHLLSYDGDDVEETFMLTFEMSMTVFGHTEQVELKKDGKEIPVTNSNRAEFVELYIKNRMEIGHEGVLKKQLEEFKFGFTRLLENSILTLFQPRELMELTAGNENYDWDALRENCTYKEYYNKDHPAVIAFWESFGMLEEEEKKKFLLFLMGTTRIPWKGMSKVEMVIQPTDQTKLPVAHTCFNLLDLPPITDKQEMFRRLKICIDNNQGFTLV